jgi:diguanylate cyclase (GGDEF)-like protein
MNLSELLHLKAQNNPDSLLKLLLKVAMVSIFVIVVISSYGFYRAFSGFVIKSAEDNSVQLCRILLFEQKEMLLNSKSGKQVRLGLDESDMLAFKGRLKNFLSPFNIIKVKIYNNEKLILFSTDSNLIGKVDGNNERLKRALAGIVDSKMVTKDKATDLSDEPLRNVDVVETYVPILGPDNRILGSFEIYVNITNYRNQIRHGVIVVTSLLALVVSSVFGFSYLLIREGTSQLKEAQAQLETIATTDSLSGIHNRGYLLKRGVEEFGRVSRSTRPLGCIMVDIDFFKKINDTWGHAAGDRVLTAVADRLKNSMRPYDIVGRYGGEEFMMLLPDTSFEQNLIVANRICELIRNTQFDIDGNSINVTASLGVASYNKTDKDLSDLIKRADEGLYKAKEGGRDRVAWIYQPGASEIG